MFHPLHLFGCAQRCRERRFSLVALAVALLVPAPLTAQQTAANAVAVLQSQADVYEKAMACRLLSQIGDEQSAEALGPLLADARLATYARSALEQISGDTAGRVLRESVAEVDGDLLVGVLDSIGRRRDRQAVGLLAERLDAESRKVAAAAARALGRIGTPESARRLQQALDGASEDRRQEIAWALLDSADKLQQHGAGAEAQKIYKWVRQQELAPQVVTAATAQLARIDKEQAPALLRQLLAAEEETHFRAGLQLARELGGTASTAALVQQFDTSSAPRQVLLLAALGDIADPAALPTLEQASTARDASIRRQAMLSLGRFDAAEAAAALMRGTVDRNPDVAAAAQQSLAEVEHPDVDRAIVTILRDPASTALPAAIEVARLRQTSAAAGPLLTIIEQARQDIRSSAIAALGTTIGVDELPQLLKLALSRDASTRDAASGALATACARLPREECAAALAEAMDGAPTEDQVMLLEQLTVLGGETALEAVANAARSDRDALQDAATRLLGEWPNSAAAPALRELAATLEDPKYRIRALRGYIRIARQLDMTLAERMEVCRQALQLAERPEEKQLVLEVLRRHPTPAGMDVAVALLDDPSLNQEALDVLISIAPAAIQEDAGEAVEVLRRAMSVGSAEQQAQIAVMMTAAQEAAGETAAASDNSDDPGFTRLFDGRTLDGWHGDRDVFRVEDGQIVGGNLQEPIARNEFLRSDEQYEDFELRLQFKLAGERPNAGVQIRTQEIPGDHEVSGYQADLGPGWWGCLYDESRRRRILAGPPEAERGKPVRENKWNDYRIRCEGPRIRLWINGVQTVDYTEPDPDIPRSGIIALQVHSGPPMEARYRDLRIKVLDGSESTE